MGPEGVGGPPPDAAAAVAALTPGGIYFAGAFGVESSLGAGVGSATTGTEITQKGKGPDKQKNLSEKLSMFTYLSVFTSVLGAQKNHLIEMVLCECPQHALFKK